MLARISRWLRSDLETVVETDSIASDYSSRYQGADADVTLKKKFVIDPLFAQRFNAYATACFPNEIGAVVRIIEDDDSLVAVDFAVLPQSVSPTYFEFTTEGQAQFQMDLATSGRGQELAEWFGLIHSHPNMTPFMSSTDVENLWKLAGNKRGFSLICAAHAQPDKNYFSVNYAQGGPLPLMIKRLAHNSADQLGGTDQLSSEELSSISAEVAEKTSQRSSGWRGPEYVPGPKNNRPLEDSDWGRTTSDSRQRRLPGLENEWFPEQSDLIELARGVDNGVEEGTIHLSALNELEASEAVIAALRLAEDLGIATVGQSAEINRRIALEEALTCGQADILIMALAEYPYTDDDEEEQVVQRLIDQLSDKLDEAEEW